MVKIKIISVLTVLAMLLCFLPSCGEKKEEGPKIIGAMLYVGDTNKQGYLITIDGTTLKYETKLAASYENFEAKKVFIETFGTENCAFEVDKKVLNEYFKNLSGIISSWQPYYAPAEGERCRQYWFVEVYYDDGNFKNYTGTQAWPDNYSQYITLTQQLSGKLFPEKIDAYMPEDIAAETT